MRVRTKILIPCGKKIAYICYYKDPQVQLLLGKGSNQKKRLWRGSDIAACRLCRGHLVLYATAPHVHLPLDSSSAMKARSIARDLGIANVNTAVHTSSVSAVPSLTRRSSRRFFFPPSPHAHVSCPQGWCAVDLSAPVPLTEDARLCVHRSH